MNNCNIKIKNKIFYALIIIAMTQFIFLAWSNLALAPRLIDGDVSDLFAHTREMWKTKSIVIDGWVNTTTLELDCASILALPIFGVTKNIFLSFGIANIILILVWDYIIYKVAINISKSQISALFAINLVMIPYGVGMLDYYNMLFINGSQYSVKILIVLLLISLLTEESQPATSFKEKNISFIIRFILYFTCLYVTSFSSGIYVLFMGIAPIALFLLYEWMADGEKLINEKLCNYGIIAIATVIPSALGLIAGKISGIETKADQSFVTSFNDFYINVQTVFIGLFEALTCSPDAGDVAVVSLAGLSYLLKIVLTLIMLITALTIQIKYIKNGENRNKFILTLIIAWDILIFVFNDTRYNKSNTYMEFRYYFIAFVCLLVLAGIIEGERIIRLTGKLQFAVITMMTLLIISCDYTACGRAEYTDYVYDIADYLASNNNEMVGSVFIYNDNDTARMLRIIDESKTYCGIDSEGAVQSSGSYEGYFNNINFSQKNALLCVSGTDLTQALGEEIASTYSYVDSIRWYDVYYSDMCTFGY